MLKTSVDIIKNKKAKKLVVKFSLILLAGIAGCKTMQPTEAFKGTFFVQKTALTNSSFSYQFKNGVFKTTLSQNLGMGAIAKGNYNITNDTLILDYEPVEGPESSTFRFKSKNPISSSDTLGSVKFEIVDREDNPVQSANVMARDRAGELLSGYAADSTGNGPEQLLTEKINNFRIMYVGKYSVTIPVDTLGGYDSEVEVMLTGITYSKKSGTKKYVITEFSNNKIVLQNPKNSKRSILIREGVD